MFDFDRRRPVIEVTAQEEAAPTSDRNRANPKLYMYE